MINIFLCIEQARPPPIAFRLFWLVWVFRAFEMALDTPDPGVYNFKANLDRMTAQLEAGEQCTARGAGAARE